MGHNFQAGDWSQESEHALKWVCSPGGIGVLRKKHPCSECAIGAVNILLYPWEEDIPCHYGKAVQLHAYITTNPGSLLLIERGGCLICI